MIINMQDEYVGQKAPLDIGIYLPKSIIREKITLDNFGEL